MNNWLPMFQPHIDLKDPAIIENIIEIEAYKKSTIKIPLPPGLKEKLNQLNIIRAIKGTTGIEGNTLSETDIEKLVGKETPRPKNLEEIEVLNANKALEYTKQISKSRAGPVITEELLRRIHRLLTEGCNYKHNIPGEYRHHPATVGAYYPPKHEDIPALMEQFISFINSRKAAEGYTTIIRAILAHFYLVSIHPFGDGNGRTSRAIEALILYSGGYNIVGFYSLANFYYKNRSKYIEELQDARFKHQENLMGFVKFSLEGYKNELELIQDEILFFIKERFFKDYVDELRRNGKINVRISHLIYHLVNYNVKIPEIAFKSRSETIVSSLYGALNERTFYRDLELMEKYNLIKTEDGQVIANVGAIDKFLE
jgi:Fic family protein